VKKVKNQSYKNELRRRAEEFITKNPSAINEIPPGDVKKLVEDLQIHQVELEMQNEELRRAQLELEAARDKYSDLYDFAPVGYFTFDETARIQEVNLTGADLLGFPKSNLLNLKFTSFISPESQDDFYFHLNGLLQTEKRQTCELKLEKKDRTAFYGRLDSIKVRDKTKNYTQIRTSLTDISEKMRAGELVRESEERFRLIFNQMVSGSALTEVIFNKSGKPCDYRYLEVNPPFEHITGKNKGQVIGKTLSEVFPEAERYWLQGFAKVALTGDPIQIENYHRGLDKYFFVSAFRPQVGQVALTFIDITERVLIEKALQKAHDKLEKRVEKRTAELAKSNASLNREITERRRLSYRFLNAQEDERRRIALELHDDLGQDLSVLKLQFDSLERQLSESQVVLKEHIARISALLSNTIEKVRRICHELIPPVLLDLGLAPALRGLIQSSAQYSDFEISSDIFISENLFSTEQQIAIYRIFQEIFNNIRKYAQATQVSIRIKRDKGSVLFRVADDGIGFDVKRIKSLSAAQRGLGLAAMEERVKMMDGNFEIFSRVGKGTKIDFAIPIADPS
jgi:PAS domain S-box-containing protein